MICTYPKFDKPRLGPLIPITELKQGEKAELVELRYFGMIPEECSKYNGATFIADVKRDSVDVIAPSPQGEYFGFVGMFTSLRSYFEGTLVRRIS